MPKITDQNVPSELRDLYDSLVSPTVADGSPQGVVRSRRGSRANSNARAITPRPTPIDRVVAGIAEYYGFATDSQEDRDWRSQRRQALLWGDMESDYWIEAEILVSGTWEVAATSVEDLPRPPYDYQTPSDRPTVTTWGTPTPSDGASSYVGALSAGLYRDMTWRYTYAAALLTQPAYSPDAVPFIATIQGGLVIDTDARASRDMCSFLTRANLLQDAPTVETIQPPPLAPAMSHYWRFRPPIGTPPYYHEQQQRLAARTVNTEDVVADARVMALTFGVRPMMGRANNNNSTVETSFDGEVTIWTVRPCADTLALPLLVQRGLDAREIVTIDPSTGELKPFGEWVGAWPSFVPCLDGYIYRGAYPDTFLVDRRFRQIATFERHETPWGTYVFPIPASNGYVGWDAQQSGSPRSAQRVTWSRRGQIISVDDYDPDVVGYQISPLAPVASYRGAYYDSASQPAALCDLYGQVNRYVIGNPSADFAGRQFCPTAKHCYVLVPSGYANPGIYLLPPPPIYQHQSGPIQYMTGARIHVEAPQDYSGTGFQNKLWYKSISGSWYTLHDYGYLQPAHGLPDGYDLTRLAACQI